MAEVAAKKPTGLLSKSSTATRTRSGRPGRKGQIAVLLFLFLCFGASLFIFRLTVEAVESSSNLPDPGPSIPNAEIVQESEDVEQLGNDLTGMTMSTNLAMQIANMAEQIGRLPVASVTTLTPPPQEIIPDVPIVEPDPPDITVKAVMITDGDSVAIIDIAGEETGLLVRRGSKFADGAARITKIDSKGVTFTWMKKSYPVALER
jgi:hypothetical protein